MTDRAYAVTVAFFAGVLYTALLIAAFGMISLLADREVVTETDAGALVGFSMTAAAVIVVLACLATIGYRIPAERQRVSVTAAVAIACAAFLAFVFGGSALYAIGTGIPLNFLTFAAGMFASPFTLAVAVLAFVVTVLYQLVLVGRFRQRGRPEWPWERNDREPPM